MQSRQVCQTVSSRLPLLSEDTADSQVDDVGRESWAAISNVVGAVDGYEKQVEHRLPRRARTFLHFALGCGRNEEAVSRIWERNLARQPFDETAGDDNSPGRGVAGYASSLVSIFRFAALEHQHAAGRPHPFAPRIAQRPAVRARTAISNGGRSDAGRPYRNTRYRAAHGAPGIENIVDPRTNGACQTSNGICVCLIWGVLAGMVESSR